MEHARATPSFKPRMMTRSPEHSRFLVRRQLLTRPRRELQGDFGQLSGWPKPFGEQSVHRTTSAPRAPSRRRNEQC